LGAVSDTATVPSSGAAFVASPGVSTPLEQPIASPANVTDAATLPNDHHAVADFCYITLSLGSLNYRWGSRTAATFGPTRYVIACAQARGFNGRAPIDSAWLALR
jgi:hypothetical protein